MENRQEADRTGARGETKNGQQADRTGTGSGSRNGHEVERTEPGVEPGTDSKRIGPEP